MRKTCSKCGKQRPLDLFGNRQKKDAADGKNTICKICKRAYQKQWKQTEAGKLSRRRYQNNKRRRIKMWLLEACGGCKCTRCPETDMACLDFHHRDRSTKKFRIGDLAIYWSRQELLEEAKKCDVLCANCHRKLHYSEAPL